jgi:spermidine/putrescine-binding protein
MIKSITSRFLSGLLVAAVAVVMLAGLAFWTAEDDKEVASSIRAIEIEKAEVTPTPESMNKGVLRLLIWEGHAPQDHVSRFEKRIEEKYDFKVKLQISYVERPDDFYSSIRRGNVDLVTMTHHLFKDRRFNYIENKLLLPLNLKNIPNFKHVTPSLQKAEYLYSDGQVYACPESQGPYGLAYNTSLMKEEPKSWNILWDPRFKGHYVIGANEYIYNAHITALALGYPRESLGEFDALNNPEFRDKLRQLALNAHSFWIGVDTPDDLSGHNLAAVWGDSLKPLQQRGELWKMAEPSEGTPFWIDNCAITSALADKPFLKKIAEEYINSLLSADHQVGVILRVVGTFPTVTNIEPLLTSEEKERVHVGTPHLFNKNRILLPTYSQRDRNGLKILWKEAMQGIPTGKGTDE